MKEMPAQLREGNHPKKQSPVSNPEPKEKQALRLDHLITGAKARDGTPRLEFLAGGYKYSPMGLSFHAIWRIHLQWVCNTNFVCIFP